MDPGLCLCSSILQVREVQVLMRVHVLVCVDRLIEQGGRKNGLIRGAALEPGID